MLRVSGERSGCPISATNVVALMGQYSVYRLIAKLPPAPLNTGLFEVPGLLYLFFAKSAAVHVSVPAGKLSVSVYTEFVPINGSVCVSVAWVVRVAVVGVAGAGGVRVAVNSEKLLLRALAEVPIEEELV